MLKKHRPYYLKKNRKISKKYGIALALTSFAVALASTLGAARFFLILTGVVSLLWYIHKKWPRKTQEDRATYMDPAYVTEREFARIRAQQELEELHRKHEQRKQQEQQEQQECARGPSMAEIDAVSGEEFEQFLLQHFRDRGWDVLITPKTNDFGVDLKGTDDRGLQVVVQAKRWSGTVGVEAVQQVYAAKGYYHAHTAYGCYE